MNNLLLAKLIIDEKRQLRDYEVGIAVCIICPPAYDVKEYTSEEVDKMIVGCGSLSAQELAIINNHILCGFTPKFSFASDSDDGRLLSIEIFMEMPPDYTG